MLTDRPSPYPTYVFKALRFDIIEAFAMGTGGNVVNSQRHAFLGRKCLLGSGDTGWPIWNTEHLLVHMSDPLGHSSRTPSVFSKERGGAVVLYRLREDGRGPLCGSGRIAACKDLMEDCAVTV